MPAIRPSSARPLRARTQSGSEGGGRRCRDSGSLDRPVAIGLRSGPGLFISRPMPQARCRAGCARNAPICRRLCPRRKQTVVSRHFGTQRRPPAGLTAAAHQRWARSRACCAKLVLRRSQAAENPRFGRRTTLFTRGTKGAIPVRRKADPYERRRECSNETGHCDYQTLQAG
jgi:hypothetical protein